MKKRFPAFFLALALCIGLAVPVFAADTATVTANGISFTAISTSKYDNAKDELGYTEPEAEFLYYLGCQAVREEGFDGFGIADFWAYLVNDDFTLDFNLKKGDKFSIEAYYLSEVEADGVRDTVYDPIVIANYWIAANKDGELVDKALIDEFFPGANYFICWLGTGDDYAWDKAVRIVFADENATPRTIPTFTDVDDWCAKAVNWAAANEITQGTGNGKFSPSQDCTHVQILTFLWRAANKPSSTATAFSNLTGDYVPAANWAYEKGLIGDSFDPSAPCTRAQAVSYIWQAFETPKAEGSSFSDVSANADYAAAVAWAVENGITNGYTNIDGTASFRPDTVCNRGVIVTLLQRAYVPSARLK